MNAFLTQELNEIEKYKSAKNLREKLIEWH